MSDRYPSIRLEGGLLSAEVIDEVAAGSLPGQRPADFGFPGSRPFIDEVAPVWAEALAQWRTFRAAVDRLDPEATAARETRDRWMGPLLSLLGYDLYRLPRAVEVDGLLFAFSHRSGPDEIAPPVHIVGCRQSLDRRPDSGRPRLGPHSLVQEFLNRTEALWGIATNGLVLRLLRDSHLIRRQSYVEFDLARMMEEERFADFALFVRLLHATRLPRTGEDVKDCLLERYHRTTVEQGGRVRDHLRDGVEKALTTIGDGLLAHPANDALRARVASGELAPFDYYQQLLKADLPPPLPRGLGGTRPRLGRRPVPRPLQHHAAPPPGRGPGGVLGRGRPLGRARDHLPPLRRGTGGGGPRRPDAERRPLRSRRSR